MRNASPLATSIIASVTMKGGIRKAVIMTPEKAPAAAQAAMPTRDHIVMDTAPASAAPPYSTMPDVATIAASAMRLPTERSMPAVMITIVMPIAMMAMTAIWLAML